MEFREAYRLGQERKALEVTAQKYDAWPKGLTIGGSSGVETIVNDINNMTKEVRKIAQRKADEIKTPRNLLDRIAFNLGYLIGSYTTITSICTSDGPVNPFTGKAFYQR